MAKLPKLTLDRATTRDGVVVLLEQGALSLMTLVVQVAVARGTAPYEYGIFFLAMTLVYFVETLHRSLVTVPYVVLQQGMAENEVDALRGSMLASTGFMLAIVGLVVVGAHALGNRLGSMSAVSPVVLAGIFAAVVAVTGRGLIRAFLLAELKVSKALAVSASCATLTMGLMAVAYVNETITVGSALAMLGIGSVIPSLVWLAVNRSRIRFSSVLPDGIRAARYGRWITLSVLVNALGVRAIPWLLALWATPAEVALFGVLATIAGIANPLINGLFSYLTPKLLSIAGKRGVSRATGAGTSVFYASLLLVPVYGALMLFFGDYLVSAFFSAEYSGHAIALSLLAMEVALKGANLVQVSMLRVVRKPKIEFIASLLGSAGCMSAALLLVPKYGVAGAAWAMLLGFAVVLVFNQAALSRSMKRSS